MRTRVFNQGFNRVEQHQIISLERSKLNRLLDEERRLIENLAVTIKRKIEVAPHRLFDIKTIWNQIQNHSLVQSLRNRINLLTDAYPQFLHQVATVHKHFQEIFFAFINAARITAQNSVCQNN